MSCLILAKIKKKRTQLLKKLCFYCIIKFEHIPLFKVYNKNKTKLPGLENNDGRKTRYEKNKRKFSE